MFNHCHRSVTMAKSEAELEAEKKAAKKAAKKKRKAEEAEAEAAAAEKPESPKKKKKKEKKEKTDTEAVEPESPKKKAKKEKKSKKKKDDDASPAKAEESASEESKKDAEEEEEEESGFKVHKKPAAGDAPANPTGTSEVFMGNLSFQIDDDTLKDAMKDCGTITNIKWLEHSDTGRFKGAGFITFDSPEAAAKAVAKNQTELLGRPMKIDFSNPRASKGGGESRPMQAKPEGCTTLFCGNLSFSIDEDTMKGFFKDCGEVSSIRWLEDKETGQFKGCGFVEFADPEASLDKAAELNGKELLGRTVRLDFATPRKPREW
jgi:nucleolin